MCRRPAAYETATYAPYALPRFSERMGLVVRMRVGDGKSPPAPTPGVDAGGRSGDPAIIIGSGTVALP